jgi:hypothetical protein
MRINKRAGKINQKEAHMAESAFNLNKFIQDSWQTLQAPKAYFSSMPKKGGYIEPIIKTAIYGLVAGIISYIWALLHLGGAGMMAGSGSAIMIIYWLIFAIIGLFIGGIILLILSAICGGNTDYETNVRVEAALMILLPVNALLSFTMGIYYYLGVIVGVLVALYGVWLLYNALISALGAKEGPAKIVAIIIAILPVLALLSTLFCYRAATTTYRDVEKYQQGLNQEQMNTINEWKTKLDAKKK